MKRYFKLLLGVLMTIVSWYGVFVLEQKEMIFIRFILLLQALVWEYLAFEWALDFAGENKGMPIRIEEEDWNSDEYDSL